MQNHTCTLWDFTVQTLYFHFSLVELIITSKPRTKQHFLIPHLSAMLQYLSLLWWAAALRRPGILLNWWWWARDVARMDTNSPNRSFRCAPSPQSMQVEGFNPTATCNVQGLHLLLSAFHRKLTFMTGFIIFLLSFTDLILFTVVALLKVRCGKGKGWFRLLITIVSASYPAMQGRTARKGRNSKAPGFERGAKAEQWS